MGHDGQGQSNRFALTLLVIAFAIYAAAAAAGLPQRGTQLVVEAAGHGEAAEHETAAEHAAPATPPYWTVAPFIVLLLAIATFPLIPWTEHWWESNLHRFYVAAGLGLIVLIYYTFFHGAPLDAHWPAHRVVEPSAGAQWQFGWTVFANAMLSEYIPFIVLLFSLYTISGGIRIQGDLPAHSTTNAAFIGVGALLASFIGTTGAAMLLIRPLLETNRERRHVAHTVVIFIFAVCNCGGLLLPIGDPPLFLGYLRGVPFLWTLHLWPEWLFVNGLLVAGYWAWDHFYFYPREEVRDVVRDETQVRRLQFRGLGLGALLLVGVILSVALLDPSKTFPGTDWHPWMYLREIVQLGLVALSLSLGDGRVRADNRFDYHAILEVAALFSGIFICMQPALQILDVVGPQLGIDTPTKFFWTTGTLSSVLDNAPTYVVFFETATALHASGVSVVAGVPEMMLVGISLGAVFMGAMTYIGNGPNFMVKAIAESSGVRMPSFFGYVVYSVCILLPLLVLTNLIFLR
jgi:Na+/H+ antiporter NhaD/arsenite permease-like protein